ncbi:hypothetical protein R6Q59_034758 [Mikania micrantha]
MHNDNFSVFPESTYEDSVIVSALSYVIREGNQVGPSSCVITEPTPEQETCGTCGMKVPYECLGCDLYNRVDEEGEEGMRVPNEHLGCDLHTPGSKRRGKERKKEKKYTGVNLRASGNYAAEIMVPGKVRKWLGTFKTEEEAARAYDRASIMHRGKAAKTNFPIEEYWQETQQDQP